jgi:hypothetical protein
VSRSNSKKKDKVVLYLLGKSPWYPFDKRIGGPRAGLDNMEKQKFLTLDSNSQLLLVIQPIGSHYTDWARSNNIFGESFIGIHGGLVHFPHHAVV